MLFRLLLACMLACASTVAVAERPCAAGADAAIPMAAQAVHAAMAMGAHAPDEPAPSRHHGGVDAVLPKSIGVLGHIRLPHYLREGLGGGGVHILEALRDGAEDRVVGEVLVDDAGLPGVHALLIRVRVVRWAREATQTSLEHVAD